MIRTNPAPAKRDTVAITYFKAFKYFLMECIGSSRRKQRSAGVMPRSLRGPSGRRIPILRVLNDMKQESTVSAR